MYTFCCVIPVTENSDTVQNIIFRAAQQKIKVLVTDGTTEGVSVPDGVEIIHQTAGRRAMFRTALDLLEKRGIDYMILLDPTGHYYPEDIEAFTTCLQKNDYTLAVGSRNFAVGEDDNGKEGELPTRKFANVMFRLETGLRVGDAASTFRAYPVKYINKLKISDLEQFDYETELLVRAAWANLEIRSLRIRYNTQLPEVRKKRHLRTHIKLLGLCLLPYRKQNLSPLPQLKFSIFRPKQFFTYLVNENASPTSLAAAAFTGTYCAVLPLFGFHTPVVLYLATVFRQNRFLAFMIQHPFTLSPLTPFLCIELGYFLRHGEWLTDFNWNTLGRGLLLRIWEWLLGSLALAPAFAALSAVTVYLCAVYVQKRIRLKFRAEYRKQKTESEQE